MKSLAFFLFFGALVCASSFASPAPAVQSHSLIRHRRQLDFFQNTGKLVQELIQNLNKAALQAREAVEQFNNGLREQAKQCRDNFVQNLKNLQERVAESVKKLQDRFTGSGNAIGECIAAHREDAQEIYNDASEQMSRCTDVRLQEGEELIKNLGVIGQNGEEIATQAFAEMRNCTQEHSGNILAVGSCIGSVALRTEVKGASFLMQSGLAIGRLNLYMSTLPAALEVCAGSSLVNAGMGTAKVLMDIGSCSTNSVINAFSGGSSLPEAASAAVSSPTVSASSAAASISMAAGSESASLSTAADTIQSLLPSIPAFP